MPLHLCILLWVNLPDASVCICLGSLIMWPSHSFEHLIVNSSKHITCILLRTCLLPVIYFSYNWAHVCCLWCVFHVTEHMSVACDVFFIELSTCLFANDAYTCLLVVFLLLHFIFCYYTLLFLQLWHGMLFIVGRNLVCTLAGTKHMLKSMASKGNCYKKINSREEAFQAFYGQGQHVNPPQLEPAGHDQFPLRHNSFEVKDVIIVVHFHPLLSSLLPIMMDFCELWLVMMF